MARTPPEADLVTRTWSSAHTGHMRVLVGVTSGVPSPPDGWWTVRVRCDGPPRMLGPILEARSQVDRLVGARTPVVELAADRFRSGLRRRLLGEESATSWPDDGDLVAELNRLADTVDGPAALVFDAVDVADAATLAFLTRVATRPGWLKPAVILGMRAEPDGRARELLDAVRSAEGEAAILRPAPPSRASNRDAPEPVAVAPRLDALPFDTLQVLRAAAVVGSGFEAELVGHLLERSPTAVLTELQRAWDAGVPLEDLGEGRFHFPPELSERLCAGLLPSLANAWNRRLAALLAEAAGDPPPPEPTVDSRDPDHDEPPRPAEADVRARSARHAAQAGDVDLAVQRYLAAARQLADRGAVDQAIAYAGEALSLLDELPRTLERRRRAASAHATIGRLLWQGSGESGTYPLDGARKSLETALRLISDTDEVAQKAEIRRLLAAVAYDQGDQDSLEVALNELTEAARELSRAGEARAAARLLNDQAAVLVAMGDPVRAAHLLEESRDTFQALAARAARTARREGRPLTAEEEADRREVAETLHLLAHLPLVVDAKPGKQEEALDRAQVHAAEAEEIYEALGMQRELGRVWQTRGRLSRRAGDPGAAREFLNRAARVQLNLGDAVGLAHTTEAMAGLLGDRGEHSEALRMLVDSVRLNHGKGSPRGLAFNRRTLQALAQGMDEGARASLAPMIMAVRRQLEAAEGQLGRVVLPGETG